jgi:hypothetical protein
LIYVKPATAGISNYEAISRQMLGGDRAVNYPSTRACGIQTGEIPIGENAHAIAQRIGEFSAGFHYEDIPEAVRDRAKYIILDGVGIAFASSSFDFAHRAYAAFAECDECARSAVIGMPRSLSLRDAVVMNSMLVHGLDKFLSHDIKRWRKLASSQVD